MPKPLYSFIFVNYQSASLLEKALRSLQPCLSGVIHELILVNNDLGEREEVNMLGTRFGAKVEHFPANYGFGKANNWGAKTAQGEILFFLNPDTTFLGGNFLSLAAAFEFHPAGIFGMRLETPSHQGESWSSGKAPRLLSLMLQKIGLQKTPKPWESKVVTPVDWVSGAALAVRKETFDAVGGFDENFFLYYEDVDFCLRAKAQGSRVFVYPFLRFFHERGQSHTSHRAMKEAYFKGQRRYFEKYGGVIEKKLVRLFQPLYHLLFF